MKPEKRIIPILLCSLVFSTGFLAMGWDNPGHMAVAGLAYDELSTAQQAQLVALLRHHPGIDLITEGFPNGGPSDRELVMAAATWPDLAKRSKAYQDNGYEADKPAVTHVTFDHLMHKGYHFIDTPLWVGNGPAPDPLPPTPEVNAVGVVKVLRSQLATQESDDAKAYDLGWLLHLVGDLHQPLHAVTGVSETCPKGDEGGNFVIIHGETHSESELHAFWDDILGKTAPSDKTTHKPRLDKDVATANEIIASVQNASPSADADNVDPAAWAAESYKMAQQDAYATDLQPLPGDRGNKESTILDTTYGQTATRDAKQRIRAAGHRLALVLKPVLQ
jgi:hypothetical protein